MISYKRLFQRAIAAAPDRLHFAAHSHHLWPDASYVGQLAAWEDGVRLADLKWDRVMGEIWPAAQHHVARELGLPDPDTVVFAPNTHDLLLRIASALPKRPFRILTSDGEFHSFRRQAARWEEAGSAVVERVPIDRIAEAARAGTHDLIFASHVQFGTGAILTNLEDLAALAKPEGPWVVIDGYHGFMATPTDLSAVADRIFYLAGGYKYAMAGEGAAFLHAPPGFGPRPEITGWYAEFDDLALPPGSIGYAPDARRFLGSTFDPSGIYRFVAVRDMLAGEGLTTATIAAHCAALRDQLLAGLPGTPLARAELLNPPDAGANARFLALRHPLAARWKAALEDQDIVTDVRGDVLRIGFGLYQDARDVDRLLGELAHLPGARP
ncbi:aminotransferase class V-fold PLP-dependent enzyme [Sphingomonas sp. LB-2]|uniref:aminotransferase class V-fold PLP-dependent enzyme n=1 Tax=Sphingomonas caeni TaxID=2984949 RepID=UPI00222FC2BA|nr:aminotransferase class V-fold PLP-dependent enzyme [Sphingomonas caeni]MCW3847183.1 aminotransferase class V-fold PLP-dependent enzyme [Sphingomonas caeni]